MSVRTADARAWAAYFRALRAEIAERKDAGLLPADLRAPGAVHRTLMELYETVDALPDDEEAVLTLPAPSRLRVFVAYCAPLWTWIDERAREGVIVTERPPAAERFAAELAAAAGLAHAEADVGDDAGSAGRRRARDHEEPPGDGGHPPTGSMPSSR